MLNSTGEDNLLTVCIAVQILRISNCQRVNLLEFDPRRDRFGLAPLCPCVIDANSATASDTCRSIMQNSIGSASRASEDKRQTDLLLKAWEESGKVYGYQKLHDDLLDLGEMCCPNRVARLTRLAGIKVQIGYKRRPGIYGGRPSVVVDNTLDRQFDVEAPDTAWVTDITYIRICEGFSYLAVAIDLYSRRVIGWAMQSRQTTDVVSQALLMVWRRNPKNQVLIHSDQGSQFTSMDWLPFLKHHNLAHSMSRRGNCHDNAVAESFFNLLKRERIRRRVYHSRDEARQNVFDYIEMFYNPKRKSVRNGMLSPVEFEKQQKI
ncbi:IS3 family transposase [Rhizobium sp. 28DA2]|uniref:IS3 family transposase n=1 Tax=Rhizobium sp. 28DA2 TaxID=3035209 RepID=UPI002B245588|nr:IS3 family transposase [Rhizobium sp. 28DA2]